MSRSLGRHCPVPATSSESSTLVAAPIIVDKVTTAPTNGKQMGIPGSVMEGVAHINGIRVSLSPSLLVLSVFIYYLSVISSLNSIHPFLGISRVF
jgi:hypothetical protein